MLFNNIDEIKELTGFVYAYNSFENIRTDIELATEELAALIGDDVMDKADNHFNGSNYGDDSYELLNNLVKMIQLPVAYFAIYSFSQNTDISHEDSGRKVKIDNEREKLPWEWMLEKDEKAILKKAYKTTDRLITFLEKNISLIPEWSESETREAIKGQFIDSASVFNEIYPIDNSRRFFLVIAPFIREAERKYIKPVLGEDSYDELKEAIAKVNLYGIVENTVANEVGVKKKDTVSMYGNAGSVTITAAGGLTTTMEYDPETGIDDMLSDFVTDNAADYLAEGIVLTSSGTDLIFEAETAGVDFTSPVVTTVPADADPDGLLPYIRTPLALYAMSIAIDRLAIEVLPEGVYQNLVSERLTQNAKQPALTEVKREVSKLLTEKANAELRYLQEYIRKLDLGEGEEFEEADLTQGLDEDELFARV